MRVTIKVENCDIGDVEVVQPADTFTYINSEPGKTIKFQTELDTLLQIADARIRLAYGIDGIKREATE